MAFGLVRFFHLSNSRSFTISLEENPQRQSVLSRSPIMFGFIFALSSALLFAIRPIFVKLAYIEGADPTTLMLLRMAMSAPIYLLLLVFFYYRGRLLSLTPKLTLSIVIVGLMGYYVASFLDLLGLQYVTAQLGRMILYIYPTLVVVINLLVLGNKPHRQTYFALAITYSGVLLIFGHDLGAFGVDVIRGACYIVACAFCFAIYLVLSKPLMSKIDSLSFTCIALLSASLGIFVHYALVSIDTGLMAPILALNTNVYWLAALIAIFCTVIPTFLTTAAVVNIGADRAAITAMIGPAFTSVFAVWILSEDYTWFHFAGMLLTIAGIALLDRKESPKLET